ncbi:hypothetical protein OZJ21_09260, partial [Ligilactobacillus sp. UO.C109]
KTGETVKVTPEVPENYEEVAGNPTDYTFPENGTDESNVVTIHLKHKHETVTRDNVVTRTIEYRVFIGFCDLVCDFFLFVISQLRWIINLGLDWNRWIQLFRTVLFFNQLITFDSVD